MAARGARGATDDAGDRVLPTGTQVRGLPFDEAPGPLKQKPRLNKTHEIESYWNDLWNYYDDGGREQHSQELFVVTLVFAKKNSLCATAKHAIFAQLELISKPMPDDLGQPKLGRHGGNRIKGEQGNAATLRSRGNSREYILARLEREGLTGWIEAIRMRRISAFAVAVDLGWAKRPQTIHGEIVTKLVGEHSTFAR